MGCVCDCLLLNIYRIVYTLKWEKYSQKKDHTSIFNRSRENQASLLTVANTYFTDGHFELLSSSFTKSAVEFLIILFAIF